MESLPGTKMEYKRIYTEYQMTFDTIQIFLFWNKERKREKKMKRKKNILKTKGNKNNNSFSSISSQQKQILMNAW